MRYHTLNDDKGTTVIVACDYCHGTGLVTDHLSEMICDECDGWGTVIGFHGTVDQAHEWTRRNAWLLAYDLPLPDSTPAAKRSRDES